MATNVAKALGETRRACEYLLQCVRFDAPDLTIRRLPGRRLIALAEDLAHRLYSRRIRWNDLSRVDRRAALPVSDLAFTPVPKFVPTTTPDDMRRSAMRVRVSGSRMATYLNS